MLRAVYAVVVCLSHSGIYHKRLCYGEGPRDTLVSRNSATYKTSHLKTSLGPIVWHYLQTDGQTDGRTTTACTALSIASRGKNRP